MTKNKKPILILVDGPSGGGKTTVANKIAKDLPSNLSCLIINQDRFYKNFKDKLDLNGMVKINYDHPNSFSWPLIRKSIYSLMDSKKTSLPIYDYVDHKRMDKKEVAHPVDVIIFEGIYALFDEEINKLASLKIFVNTPMDECFIRRVLRDVKERGRTLDSVINQWRNTVKPMYKAFIEPLKSSADIILPWNQENHLGVNILRHGLKGIIKENDELLSKE